MSFLALPQDYRFAIYNGLGSAGTVTNWVSGTGANALTITGRRMRFDTNGLPAYESAMTSFFMMSSTSLANGSYMAGSAITNFSSVWLGGEFLISVFISGGASGSILVFLETSPDGGTTWPTVASGLASALTFPAGALVVAAIGYGSVISVISNASSTVRQNFNL